MSQLRFLLLVVFLFVNNLNATVFVIGDVHGDLQALRRILVGFNLIDQNNNWIGGQQTLVTMGDLVDRGPQVREVLDLMMKLESQAQLSGGQIHNLLGNHEILALKGIMDYSHMNDHYAFQEFKGRVRASKADGYKNAFKGNTLYANWFASRRAMVVIEGNLFVHAGLDEKSLSYSLEDMNKMISDWVLYLQDKASRPSPETEWVLGSEGPLWTRKLSYEMDTIGKKLNPDLLPEEKLNLILKHFGVKRIFIGHSLVTDFNHTVNHPVYGDKVISTDTGINEIDKLIVSGFKIADGVVEGFWFDRKVQSIKMRIKSQSKHLTQCLKNYSL